MHGRKSLDAKRNAAVRAFVRRVVADEFKGNVSAASVAFDVSQSTLSDFLNEKRGAGVSLLDGVASHCGVSIDVVLGRAIAPSDPDANKRRVQATPEYQSAPLEAREAFDSIHEDLSVVGYAWELLRLVEWSRRGWMDGQRLRGRPELPALGEPSEAVEDRATPSRISKA